MPRGRQPQGEHPLSDAERQARYRRPANHRTRPQRWRDAVAELLTLQAEYAAWCDEMPGGLRDTAAAAALEAIVDLDLDALAAIEPPRGYGRNRNA